MTYLSPGQPSLQILHKLIQAGADVELLLLAAADLDRLDLAQVLVWEYKANGLCTPSDENRTAKAVGSNSSEANIRSFFEALGCKKAKKEAAPAPAVKHIAQKKAAEEAAAAAAKQVAQKKAAEETAAAKQVAQTKAAQGAAAAKEEVQEFDLEDCSYAAVHGSYGKYMCAADGLSALYTPEGTQLPVHGAQSQEPGHDKHSRKNAAQHHVASCETTPSRHKTPWHWQTCHQAHISINSRASSFQATRRLCRMGNNRPQECANLG